MSAADGDLITYRWSERSLLGRNGVGPVVTSLDPDALVRWDDRLRSLVWAAVPGEERPARPGHVYRRFGDRAVLLRKESVRDAKGRVGSTEAHVLIAPADRLTPRAALAICATPWQEWLPPETGAAGPGAPPADHLRPVRLDRLLAFAERFETDALDELDEVPHRLAVRLGALLLAEPDRPLTVIGSPASGEAVVRTLARVLGGFVAHSWEFATLEESDTAAELPALVFLDQSPPASLHGGHGRLRVRADAAIDPPAGSAGGPGDRGARDLAERLFSLAHRLGPQILDRLRPEHAAASGAEVLRLGERLLLAPGVLGDVDVLLRMAALGDLTPEESGYLTAPRFMAGIEDGLHRLPPGELAAVLRLWAQHPRAVAGFADARTLLHTEALARCLAARPGGEAGLRAVLAAGTPDPRAVRRALDERILPRMHQWDPQHGLLVLDVLAELRAEDLPTEQQGAQLVARLGPERLLDGALRRVRHSPGTARILLRGLGPNPSRRTRSRLSEVLERSGAVPDLLARLCVDVERGDGSPTARHLLTTLLDLALGPRADADRLRRLLAACGPVPPPALLRALLHRAGSRRGREVVRSAAADLYLFGRLGRADGPRALTHQDHSEESPR
ncbi:hypothetical protein ACFRAR_08140 [Kitasatospora sp. NPDC056651]|uniref:hypothetical protein n=1 Tax=Kitasatospora sp. NPDC056651 TaxID=3345892 RepID=UPI0036CC5FF4